MRATLEAEPTDYLTVTIIGEYLDREAEPGTIAVADVTSGGLTSPFNQRDGFNDLLDDNDFALNDPNFVESETTSFTGLVNWRVGSFTVDSITSYRSYDLEGAQDSDGTELTLFNNFGSFRNEQFSQELRIASDPDQRLSWLAGLYYIDEENEMNPFVINNINAFFGLGTRADFRAFQDLESAAAFANVDYELTDQLTLTLGGRYSWEEKSFDSTRIVDTIRAGFFPPAGIQLPAGAPVVPETQFIDKEDWTDFSPRVVLTYQASDSLMIYGSFSQGFKSGGFNSFGLTPAFEPEEIDAWEIGLKSDLAGGLARVNASAFYYDYTDLQVRLGVPTGGVDIQNAAEAEIAGAELDITLLPVEDLRLDIQVAYLDATFSDGELPTVPPDVQFPIGAPIPLINEELDGNYLSRAPEWQVNLAAEYRWPLARGGEVALRSTFFWHSETFFLETNQDQPTFQANDRKEANVRLSYLSPNEGWEVGIYGQNIFDERRVTQISQLGSFPNAAINEPAKYGFDLRWNF